MDMKLRIVLTGAAGNLGRKLRAHWSGQHDVLGIDAQTGGDDGIVAADLTTDDRRWVSRLAGCDVVVHCAANGSPSHDWRGGQRQRLRALHGFPTAPAPRRPAPAVC